MIKTYNFSTSLDIENGSKEWFDTIYESLGCTVSRCDYNDANGRDLQRKDIDVILKKGNDEYTVSEKKREKDYGDLYVEHYSSFENKTIGWTAISESEFLFYGIKDPNVCHIYRMADVKNYYNKIVNEVNLGEIESEMISKNQCFRTAPIPTLNMEICVIVAQTNYNNNLFHTTGFSFKGLKPKRTLYGNK